MCGSLQPPHQTFIALSPLSLPSHGQLCWHCSLPGSGQAFLLHGGCSRDHQTLYRHCRSSGSGDMFVISSFQVKWGEWRGQQLSSQTLLSAGYWTGCNAASLPRLLLWAVVAHVDGTNPFPTLPETTGLTVYSALQSGSHTIRV